MTPFLVTTKFLCHAADLPEARERYTQRVHRLSETIDIWVLMHSDAAVPSADPDLREALRAAWDHQHPGVYLSEEALLWELHTVVAVPDADSLGIVTSGLVLDAPHPRIQLPSVVLSRELVDTDGTVE